MMDCATDEVPMLNDVSLVVFLQHDMVDAPEFAAS
jgi:hypothetical protein